MAYCADCGSKLYFHTQRVWNKARTESYLKGSYSCSVYRKQTQYQHESGRGCTAHYISESMLEQLVLEELRELLCFVRRYEDRFVLLVADKNMEEQQRGVTAAKKALVAHQQRIAELDALIERLYEDNVIGRVTDERYEKMSARFEAEQAGLKELAASLEAELAELERQCLDVNRFLAIVRRYTQVEKLTPAIVHEFIDRIVIHEPEKARGGRVQKVEIAYNNVGALDPASFQQQMGA